MGEMRFAVSPLSLARELYRYGEPALADRALALGDEAAVAIGKRIGDAGFRSQAHRIWPDGPADAVLLVAAVAYLEGVPRPCARTRRLPESALPEHLRATEGERYAAALPAVLAQIRDAAATPPPPRGLAARLRGALRRDR